MTERSSLVKNAGAGFLLEKEIRAYYDSVEQPEKPLVAVIGGAKVSGKLAALENMLNFHRQHDHRWRQGEHISEGTIQKDSTAFALRF